MSNTDLAREALALAEKATPGKWWSCNPRDPVGFHKTIMDWIFLASWASALAWHAFGGIRTYDCAACIGIAALLARFRASDPSPSPTVQGEVKP